MISKFKIPLAIIIAALIALVIFLVYTQNNSKKQDKASYQKSVQLPSPTPTLADVQKAITEQLNAKNYSKIESSMQKPNVEVTIQSTECCMFLPPEKVSGQLNYVEKGIPMDFNQNNQTIVDLKTKHRELKNAYIGISKNGTQLIAFYFNKDNAISSITMAASWKIFDFNEPQPLPN